MLLLDPTTQPDFFVSRANRTRTELLANRRRFQREGVTLVAGDRNSLFFLPIEARRSIAVRPGVRLSDFQPSTFDQILDGALKGAFAKFGTVLYPFAFGLLAVMVAVQIYIHFHPSIP
jgi:hypothetical protein